MSLFSPLALPNGAYIANRIAKAAMEENMADGDHAPSAGLLRLYEAWAEGEAGLIITGNVMVDARAMTGPGGVVLEDDRHLDRFSAWAAAGRSHGAQMWMQINHPGRQMPAALGQETLAPSAVAMEMGVLSKQFPVPREMTAADIADVERRFVATALLAERAGFTGVEVHAAHGYLLSQFLSPLTNRRQDRWGGSLENRARLLLDIVRAIRAAVAPGIATALAIDPALPRNWRLGRADAPALQPIAWKNKQLASTAHMAAVKYQLTRLSRRQRTAPGVSPAWALVLSQVSARRRAKRYRRWMETRKAAA